jgi:restriction system protein
VPEFWMVRAGERGFLAEEFERAGCVAIGWSGVGDFAAIRSLDAMRQRILETQHESKPGAVANSASMAWKFRSLMKKGDRIVTYNPGSREYLIGTIVGEYEYAPGIVPEYNHVRRVQWDLRVNRDDLSPSSRNSLGSTLTIFQPGPDVVGELLGAGSGEPPLPEQEEESGEDEWQAIRRDLIDRAHEFIKDRLLRLSAGEMEELAAAVLRAMGYKARVTPKGPDRGRDVLASPDGLGFQAPRIIAEVKHRSKEAMGSPQIRGFLGGLRAGDNGLYVSTGGFTREARYEADRASVPITLVDLDELASLVVEHYDRFDAEGRSLLPLTRIYWPAS